MSGEREYKLAELRRKYAYQFPSDCDLSLPAGWYDLFGVVCGMVDEALCESWRHRFQWEQVKEKFAEMRAYYSVGIHDEEADDPAFQEIVKKISAIAHEAEDLASRICQECGDVARKVNIGGFWVAALCETHAAEQSAQICDDDEDDPNERPRL